MAVHHLTARGSNFEIGRQIGTLAIQRYGKSLEQYKADNVIAGARKTYFQRYCPIHWERVRGVMAAFGVEPSDDNYDLTGLAYNMDIPAPPGCSVVYYPPSSCANGAGHLSRNYDFPIVSLSEMLQMPLPPERRAKFPPMMSEPYIMEWHPSDGGYSSLAIHAFDLLSGTLDGINSAGLVVSILADEEAIAELGPHIERHPTTHHVVGLHELQAMRFLLDNCATAQEAESALLTVKQYYSFAPCHYIVGDITGSSFVYENSTGRNEQYVIRGNGRDPQAITNFQLHKHMAVDQSPVGALTIENNAIWRYRTLRDRFATGQMQFTADDMKANNACVNVRTMIDTLRRDLTQKQSADELPFRTLWHSLYDQKSRTAEFSFYLGEDVQADGTRAERRSEYIRFMLN